MTAPNEFLSLREQLSVLQFSNDVDGIPGLDRIGESLEFETNVYAANTDLFDNEPDPVLGTKTGTVEVIAQLGNGEIIDKVEETIQLSNGNIFTKGFVGGDAILSGETTTVQIIGGTDKFKDISGVENVTAPDLNNLSVVDLSLLSFKKIEGTRNSDVIKATKHSEFITGNNGDDVINARQGDDIIEGDRGGDTIRGGAGDDTLAADRIDRFQDFDGSKSELKGDSGDDIIYGGSKDDLIGGGNGDDFLFGNSGDDLIRGGSGFDLIQGGVGNDTLRGQGDIDVADYSDLTFNGVFGTVAGVDVNLRRNQARHSSNNNALTWTDTLTTIENVIGTSRNDRFIGDSNDNIFYGLEEVGRDERQTEFIGLDHESYQVTGDVVEYDGNQSDFTFSISQQPYVGGLTVTGDGIGTDILLGIELIKFDDGLVATNSINH